MLDKKLILGLLFLATLSGCVLSPSTRKRSDLRTGLSKGCVGSIIEMDNVQERLDRAAPLIAGSHTVGQTFVSHHPRLSAVELLLVVYPDDGASPDTPRNLTLHLRSGPQNEADIATLTVNTSNLKHNDPCQISFPPQTSECSSHR